MSENNLVVSDVEATNVADAIKEVLVARDLVKGLVDAINKNNSVTIQSASKQLVVVVPGNPTPVEAPADEAEAPAEAPPAKGWVESALHAVHAHSAKSASHKTKQG